MSDRPRLLDQVHERVRMKHYSLRTEQAYTECIKRYILIHGKQHPRGHRPRALCSFPLKGEGTKAFVSLDTIFVFFKQRDGFNMRGVRKHIQHARAY
ncbi:MAG TPA: phage integrase N-terminal SAM-like domain-containing protein [Gammaproteobacteria bacterium]|nr:phage integrase N-terminal SAM-like domain-containing protein [Gammaproteobacteria bacterium]